MIANTKHMAIGVKLTEQKDCPKGLPFPQNGSPYCVIMNPITSPWGVPCTAPPWATLAAVDLESGDTLWKIPLGTLKNLAPWPFYHFIDSSVEMGGPMITASGLVFIAATSDSYIQAYDIDDGTQLWRDELPTSGNAVPMSYTYRDEQYIVIAAGGHFISPLPSGDYLVAFKLESDD